jgi:hypothetical protein
VRISSIEVRIFGKGSNYFDENTALFAIKVILNPRATMKSKKAMPMK